MPKIALNTTTIHIEQDLLSSPILLDHVCKNIALVVDENVYSLFGKKILSKLTEYHVVILSFPSGESSKSREMKEKIENQMFENGLGRDTLLIAMGGGVATDLGGFIASTYCRGIPLILIPTTLLGMVDASIGGKTGINVSYGKNLIGAFYQPMQILMDPLVLTTLPERERLSGLAEVIKHGLIKDAQLTEMLENQKDSWDENKPDFLTDLILRSVEIKKDVVEKDPFEKGLRRIVNFGHTIGHALESAAEYSITHGEAIAIGMIAEAHLGVSLSLTPEEVFDRVYNLMKQYNYPLRLPESITAQQIFEIMKLDKKSVNLSPRIVFLKEIGQTHDFEGNYCLEVPEKPLIETLNWMLSEFKK